GGVRSVIMSEHGCDLPRRLLIELSKTIQAISEDSGTEISPAAMWDAFQKVYLPEPARYVLKSHELTTVAGTDGERIEAEVTVDGVARKVSGAGNGPIAAF